MRLLNVECPGWRSAPGQTASVMAVLAAPDNVNAQGGRVVYIAIVKRPATPSENLETARWVMVNGTKVRFQHATMFFPMLKPDEYNH